MPPTEDTSQFTFISHDEDSKERKHRLYSHSRNATIRNRRRLGREALRPARPLPVKDFALQSPPTTADPSASTLSTTSRPSLFAAYSDFTTPLAVSGNSREARGSPSIDLSWSQTYSATIPMVNDFYTDAGLHGIYPQYLPRPDPEPYAAMSHDTALDGYEESTLLSTSLPAQPTFMADHNFQSTWLQTEDFEGTDSFPGFARHNTDPAMILSASAEDRTDGPRTSHQSLFFGLDLEDENEDNDDAILAAFEEQSASIDRYNALLMHPIVDNQDPGRDKQDTSQGSK